VSAVLWLSAAVLVLATYFSALSLAMLMVSRSALEQRLEAAGHGRRGTWLFGHLTSTRQAVALLRTALRLMFFALVLVEVMGVGETSRITYGGLAIAGAIALAILWICTIVLASSLARHVPEAMVAGALPMMRVVAFVFSPLTRGLSFIDEAVRRLTGANLREREDEAEAELLRSIEDTHREGALDERAATLLENVVEFSSTDVGEVMTPRTDIEGIEVGMDLPAIRSFIIESGHSRIPVYEENVDHVVGILYVKDLIPHLGEEVDNFQLRPLLRQPIVVPETKPVRELLADFQRSEVHMAMVIDEYGGTAGLVTIEDVLEEIVGEIHDEHDLDEEPEPTFVEVGEGRCEVDGRYHIDDLNEQWGLDLPEDEEFDTIGGFVLASLGRVPEVGETFESHEARFTALAATPTHVQKVGIERLHPANGNGEKRRKGNGG
jgi:putative hemolysin